jgi:hypothetical protein
MARQQANLTSAEPAHPAAAKSAAAESAAVTAAATKTPRSASTESAANPRPDWPSTAPEGRPGGSS